MAALVSVLASELSSAAAVAVAVLLRQAAVELNWLDSWTVRCVPLIDVDDLNLNSLTHLQTELSKIEQQASSAGGLPSVAANGGAGGGTVTMTIHQVNQDGAGPYKVRSSLFAIHVRSSNQALTVLPPAPSSFPFRTCRRKQMFVNTDGTGQQWQAMTVTRKLCVALCVGKRAM